MWARAEAGGEVRVGFTHVPCYLLGDVVYVELPPPGTEVRSGEPIGLVESSSAVCEVAAPVSGTVTRVNDALELSPEKITSDPFGEGWLLVIRPSDSAEPGALLDPGEYARYAGTES